MIPHGIRSTYVLGCRCTACTAANTAYCGIYIAMHGPSPQKCGTRVNYVRGCRCTECTEANRLYSLNYKRSRRKPIEVTHDNGDIAPPAL